MFLIVWTFKDSNIFLCCFSWRNRVYSCILLTRSQDCEVKPEPAWGTQLLVFIFSIFMALLDYKCCWGLGAYLLHFKCHKSYPEYRLEDEAFRLMKGFILKCFNRKLLNWQQKVNDGQRWSAACSLCGFSASKGFNNFYTSHGLITHDQSFSGRSGVRCSSTSLHQLSPSCSRTFQPIRNSWCYMYLEHKSSRKDCLSPLQS